MNFMSAARQVYLWDDAERSPAGAGDMVCLSGRFILAYLHPP
jgi:hypothetical protein